MIHESKPKYIASAMFKDVFLSFISDMEIKKSKIPAELGISYDIFCKIVDFGKIPRPQILVRISDKLNCSVEYLLGRTKDETFEMATDRASFLERLDYFEKKLHVSDYFVARKLHVSANYITNWRKSNYTPSFDNLVILSEVFNTSLDFLLAPTAEEAPYKIDPDWH